MHTGPIPEDKGTFSNRKVTQIECRKCHKTAVTCATWDSSDGAYTDYKYTCGECGYSWWVDGPDA